MKWIARSSIEVRLIDIPLLCDDAVQVVILERSHSIIAICRLDQPVELIVSERARVAPYIGLLLNPADGIVSPGRRISFGILKDL